MKIHGPPLGDLKAMVWMAELPVYWAQRQPDARAFVANGHIWTYADLDCYTKRILGAWLKAGVGPGDRVAYIGRNSELFYAVFFACARGGFILVPINWRSTATELQFMLRDCCPRVVIHDGEFLKLAEAGCVGLSSAPDLLQVEGPGISLRSLSISGRVAGERTALDFNAPFLQLYTSGTTGRPKGALLSHGGISVTRYGDYLTPQWDTWSSKDVVLAAMPNFHIAGIGFVTHSLAAGATCVHTADPSPTNLLALSRMHCVSRVFMVPTVIREFLKCLKDSGEGAPRFTTLYYGASPIDPLLREELMSYLKCQLGQYYGMTETSGTGTFLGASDHDATKPHLMLSVGRPFAGVSIETRRPDASSCDIAEPGEVYIRALANMIGYSNRENETATSIQSGWYKTGDGGFIDSDGYLYLTDRIRDLIISGGENVYPVEVENVLREHPAVSDVAVVGFTSRKWGEAVTAVVEWRSNSAASLEDLRAFGRLRLAGYKLPQRLYTVEALPRTASGKIQRAAAKLLVEELDHFSQLDS